MFYRLSAVLFLFAWLGIGLLASSAYAQEHGIVQGRIVNASDGSPPPGANIVVEGITIGTSADQNGRYQLTNVPAGSDGGSGMNRYAEVPLDGR